MKKTKPKDVNEYIAGFPKETQKVLKQVRTTIKKSLPGADEVISYEIPAFKLNGKAVIYFAGYENHVSLYPAPRGAEEFKKTLSAYKDGKGTVQFPLDKPMPTDLITRIVKFRLTENQQRINRK